MDFCHAQVGLSSFELISLAVVQWIMLVLFIVDIVYRLVDQTSNTCMLEADKIDW